MIWLVIIFILLFSQFSFTKQHVFSLQSNTFICPTQLQFRFPPNLFLAIVNTHDMCHAKYSTWLYIPYKYKCKQKRNTNKTNWL